MTDNEFNLEFGGDDELQIETPGVGGLDLGDAVVESLGISGIDNLVLDDEDIDLGLFEDEDQDSSGISDSILLRTSVSVVDTLVPYAQRVREAVYAFGSKKSTVDHSQFVIAHSEFSYMPRDVFVTFHQILLDIACRPENLDRDLEDCAEESIASLYEATRWSPQLNRPEYIQKFSEWCGRFRVLAQIRPEKSKSDITTLISEDNLKLAMKVFEINTTPFVQLNSFFQDAASMASQRGIADDVLGEFTHTYMARNNLRVFTVRDGYNAISEYLGSEETRNSLQLSQDEIIEFSSGELLRRLILFELNNGFLYPSGMRGKDPNNPKTVITMLDGAIKSGSVAAEIIYIIGVMLMHTDKNNESVTRFLVGMSNFFMAFLDDPALVNPVFYGHVKHTDGGYELSYAINDKTFEMVSPDVLCDVIGDKAGTKCIPKVLLDARNGFMICPPPQLVSPLRQLTIGGKNHVSGAMCYKFSPTVSWLMANHVLAEECVEEPQQTGNALQAVGGGLLQVLLSYDNKFDNDGHEVMPVVLSYNDYVIHAVGGGKEDETLRICAVESGGSVIANTGTMLYDKDTGNVIVSFVDTSRQLHEFVAENGTYSEEYLGVQSDKEDHSLDLSDFIVPSKRSKVVEYRGYRNAVMNLCELAALDYEEELQEVQQVIARDLFYAVCIPNIDALVATRILQAYRKYAEARKEAGEVELIDPFNMPSFQELYDMVAGRPNAATSYKTWDAALEQIIAGTEQDACLDVDCVCEKLDCLDFDQLALQIVSRGELKREVRMDVYNAIRFIPEIGSRLCVLEDKMVTLRVLEILGDQVVSVFSKHLFLVNAYTSQVVRENVEIMSSILLEKSRKKGVDFALPLSKKVLSAENNPDSVIFKYFVLERNIYGLLSAMQTSGSKYSEETREFLTALGLDPDVVISEIGAAEFHKEVSRDTIVRFCNDQRDRLQHMVEEGLVNEVTVNKGMQLIKAYDLFNTFYDMVVGTMSSGPESTTGFVNYEQDFLKYAGSLVVSYAPITDSSAGDVDGGENRFAAFIKSPQDFWYDVPIDYLRPLELQDVRVIVDD